MFKFDVVAIRMIAETIRSKISGSNQKKKQKKFVLYCFFPPIFVLRKERLPVITLKSEVFLLQFDN